MTIDEMIEILKPYKNWVFGDQKYGEVSVKDIIEALTVDAEPVVRCKDCFHFAPGTEKFDAFCVHNSVPIDEDGMGFCSEGVKKTEILDDPMEGESRQ